MKKIVFMLLAVIMITFVWARSAQVTTTGTTTSGYVTVYTINCDDFVQAGVTLKNTGSSSKHIQFQVISYVHPDAAEYRVLATADDLADGKTATVNINDTYFLIIVQVMYPAGGAASTFSCSYRVSR